MKSNTAENTYPLTETREGFRDELNFAEFPLALLDRPSEGQKSVEFSDTIFDRGRNAPVVRKLTISASDRYGLPTPRDEEVILGLIQLSHQSNFTDRKVFFSKGSLVKLLGWNDDGRSYLRITESLNRWAGTTLFYEKAWWSKADNCWVDETFHILDNVTLFDEARRKARNALKKGETNSKSSFVWNERVFASFKSGYLKQLDLDFFKSLDSAISKRIFRFLDKKFYKTKRLEFDLETFSFEHIALSRNYHTGEIKRRLKPAIQELEEKGFLESIPDDERFIKESRGKWKIRFIKKGAEELSQREVSPLESELLSRGVSQKAACEITSKYSNEKIEEKLALHDELLRRNDSKVSKNPAGFLVAAIREDFSVGKAQSAKTQSTKVAPKVNNTLRVENVLSELRLEALEKGDRKLAADFDAYFDGLSITERQAFEAEALQRADAFSTKQYESGKAGNGSLFKVIRRNILLAHYRASVALR